MPNTNFTLLGQITPSEETRAGRMLAAGRLTITMLSMKSGEHLTLEFAAKKKQESFPKWKSVGFAEASHVFVKTNGEDRVGTFYPNSMRFYPAANADPARVWAAQKILLALRDGQMSGETWTLQEANACGRCGRELTDPISIERGIGPDCYGQMTGSQHQVKQQSERLPLDPTPAGYQPNTDNPMSLRPRPGETAEETLERVITAAKTTPRFRDVPSTFAELAARIKS